jgi:hypothetical protein
MPTNPARNTPWLRLDNTLEHDPAIDAWLHDHTGPLGDIAQHWFSIMRRCGDEVCELLHDGCPVACFGDAPFAYVNVFTAHTNVGFFQGSPAPGYRQVHAPHQTQTRNRYRSHSYPNPASRRLRRHEVPRRKRLAAATHSGVPGDKSNLPQQEYRSRARRNHHASRSYLHQRLCSSSR